MTYDFGGWGLGADIVHTKQIRRREGSSVLRRGVTGGPRFQSLIALPVMVAVHHQVP